MVEPLGRLILLPAEPGPFSGYTRVVADDVARLGVLPNDRVVVRPASPAPLPEGWRPIRNPAPVSLPRLVNTLAGRLSGEVLRKDLRPHVDGAFTGVFCGDVVFYRALRSLLPDDRLTVRLHNVFGLVAERQRRHGYRLDPVFRLNLTTTSRLERRIFGDRNADLIFISEAERDFFLARHPGREAEVWSLPTPEAAPVRAPSATRLLYLGSLPRHQLFAMRYFVAEILPEVRRRVAGLELHLYGRGTEGFDDPEAGVRGHGRFAGPGPPAGGDGLFVNPDLLGGGQKVKIADWLAWGVPFITTGYGLDGYQVEPGPHRIVAEIEEWPDAIAGYFASRGRTAGPGRQAPST